MKIAEIRDVARSLGIQPNNFFKTELIKTIQQREGNFDCYGTAHDGVCDQIGCCWRKDCLEVSRIEDRI